MSALLHETQQSLFAIQANFPVPGIGGLMRLLTFPLGGSYAMPSDKLNQAVSKLITTDSEVRKLLAPNIFVSSKDPTDRVAMINRALPKVRRQRRRAAQRARRGAARALTAPLLTRRTFCCRCRAVPRGGRHPRGRAQGQARAHRGRAGGHRRGRGAA